MKRNSTPCTKGIQGRTTDSDNRKASKAFEHENDTENRVYISNTGISNHLTSKRSSLSDMYRFSYPTLRCVYNPK